MGVLAECPYCLLKQATKNKVCKCGRSLDQAKKAKKIKYWISYLLPNGRQRRESVDAIQDLNGYSIEDARDAFAKRRVDKKENKMFDIKQDTKMTFNELTDWYLKLEKVYELASSTPSVLILGSSMMFLVKGSSVRSRRQTLKTIRQ